MRRPLAARNADTFRRGLEETGSPWPEMHAVQGLRHLSTSVVSRPYL